MYRMGLFLAINMGFNFSLYSKVGEEIKNTRLLLVLSPTMTLLPRKLDFYRGETDINVCSLIRLISSLTYHRNKQVMSPRDM